MNAPISSIVSSYSSCPLPLCGMCTVTSITSPKAQATHRAPLPANFTSCAQRWFTKILGTFNLPLRTAGVYSECSPVQTPSSRKNVS
jgi:hypothetical protein